MKLVVVHKNGDQEVITLTEPLTVVRGEKLNRLETSTGAEHWFDQDGWYDVWGMAVNIPIPASGVPADGSIPKDAMDAIEEFDKGREFPHEGGEPK
jgi:hypothetical protein